jgi:hypothetical protein
MSCTITTIGDCRFSRLIMLLWALGAGSVVTTTALSDEPAPPGARTLTYSLQVITKGMPTSDPACPLKVLIEGAGLTNLLGPIHDVQSHCAQEDGTVDNGVFTFTGAALGGLPGGDDSGDSITGQYRAHLMPSLASQLSNPPAGYWLTYGEVCIWKGTGKYVDIINDCPQSGSSGRFFPARLTLDFNTGQANVFGTAIVRFSNSP